VSAAVCPSCCSSDTLELGPIPAAHLFAGRRLAAPLPGGALHRCGACQLGFRWPRPGEAELVAYYEAAPETHWQYEPAGRRDWQLAAGWLGRGADGERVLDVGCHDGAFLATLGPAWEKLGVELNQAAARRAEARGVRIVGRDVTSLAADIAPVDAAVAFDVAEHVADPRDLLRTLRTHVRPGGTIILSSGDMDARCWRLLGSRYWYCAIPEHISFLSESWCRAAAAAVDLELTDVVRFSHAAERGAAQRAGEAARNLIYRTAPGMVARLRRAGLGTVPVAEHPELAEFPPQWLTARDHLIARFRRR
jgi:SAM-dependent methyltransferase